METTNVQLKPGKQVKEFIFKYSDTETAVVNIQEPGWEETVEAFKCLSDAENRLDMITPGRLIFDLCCTSHTKGIANNHKLMMSICSQLTTYYTLPLNAELEVKKNDIV